jgi:acyl carrier protein
MPDETWERVVGVLRHVAPSCPADVRPGDRLIDDLGLDSMALAKAVMALEDQFGLELPPQRLHELRSATVGDLAGMVLEAAQP